MTTAHNKTVRALLNSFFDDVYRVLDPISEPETIKEALTANSWKTEWNHIKKLGFRPGCDYTRYKFSFFMFGRDKNKYKPNRDVKNIVEAFCRRFPIEQYYSINWSQTDPDYFHYYRIDKGEEDEVEVEVQGNLATQPEKMDEKTDLESGDEWTTVPGIFDPVKNQSPQR